MTWTDTPIGAVELAALADDKPILMATSCADWRISTGERYGDRVRWNEDGDFVAADASAATMPARRAVDRHGQTATSPATAETTWYLVFDAQYSEPVDCVYLEHDGLESVTDLSVAIEFSDANDFSGAMAGGSLTISAGRCVTFLDDRWSGGGYVRIVFSAPSAFTPVIREAWCGRRRQLRRAPDRPVWIERVVTERVGDASTLGGAAYAPRVGRGVFSWSMVCRDTDDDLLDSETISGWWSDSRYGVCPSVVIPRPTSYPHRARIMRTTEPLVVRRVGWGERTYSLELAEIPPYLGGES